MEDVMTEHFVREHRSMNILESGVANEPANNIVGSDLKSRHRYYSCSVSKHDRATDLITIRQLCMLWDADSALKDGFTAVTLKSTEEGVHRKCQFHAGSHYPSRLFSV
jgi:hypothetical protein